MVIFHSYVSLPEGMAPLFGKQQGCHQSGQEPCFFALGGLVEKRVCLAPRATDVATEWPRLLLRFRHQKLLKMATYS